MTIATIDRTVQVKEDELVRFVEADYGSLVAALELVCGDRPTGRGRRPRGAGAR